MSTRTWMNSAPLMVLLTAALGSACVSESETRELQPLDTAQLGFTAAANLRSVASAFGDASDWMADGELSSWLGDMATEAVDGAAADIDDPPMSGDDEDRSPESIADELADRIEHDFLLEEHLESNDGTTAVYLIPADRVCADVGDEALVDDTSHADCVRRFTAVPLRVRVVSYAPNDLDLTLLVGEARLEPLSVELHQAELALRVDVGASFEAMQLLGQENDDPGDEVVLRSVAGVVEVALEKRGARHARASFEVSSPLSIDADVGAYPIALSLGRSKTSVDIDADRQRVVFETVIGTLKASAPYQLLADLVSDAEDGEPAPVVAGLLALDLAGWSAQLTLDDQDDVLALKNLGLGDHRSTLKLDDKTVVGVDLNATSGRDFDLTLTAGGEDQPTLVSVSPELDLAVELGLRHLGAIAPEAAASWAASELLGIALDGGGSPTLSLGEELRVTAGRLALASRARPELNLEVRAGQCLMTEEDDFEAAPSDDEGADAHPFVGFFAGACGQ